MKFTDDFAKKYWKEFESLVLEIIRKECMKYDEFNTNIHPTKNSKDGGYDGIIFVETKSKGRINLKEFYSILVEAKLRKNANNDLPLSDFSKTLIVAINKNANEVFIFTNLHFSKETQKRISMFENATSLNVKLVDIFAICDMLLKHQNIQLDFSEEFIDELLEAKNIHDENKKISYESEVIFYKSLPELIGDERTSLRDEYIKLLKNKNGVMIITGIQGCGKSLLLKHIINELQHDSHSVIIELQKFSTITEFFVQLLSIIWNVDPIDIYNLTIEDINEITSYMSDEYFSQKMKNILINILTNEVTIYEKRQNLFESHLIEYLHKIFLPILERRKYIISFTNFEKAEDNIINFTDKFIKSLCAENILFIIEIRNDLPRLLKYEKKWRDLCTNIEPIELGVFSYTDYIQYMEIAHSDIPDEIVEKLYDICFPLPIYIDNMLTFIQDRRLESLLYDDNLNIQKLYENRNFQESSINYSIEKFFSDKDSVTKKLAVIISMFEGALNIKDILKLGGEFKKAIDNLSNSIYFDLEAETLKLHHIIYLKPLQNRKYISPVEFKEALNLLFEKIPDFTLGETIIKTKKFHIAILISNDNYIKEYWEEICTSLINQEDYRLAQKFLVQIYENNRSVVTSRLKILTRILQCYIGLNQYDSKDLQTYINIADKNLKKEENFSNKTEYLFVKTKIYMVHGEYEKIIQITNLYCNNDNNLRYIRALAIKHLFGINQCLLSLKRGIQHFPHDWHLKYSYLDHMHSKYEKKNCDIAWRYLDKIKPYYSKLTLEDQIHYKYNMLAILFYRDKLTNLDKCRELISESFQNNLLVEEGRIHNLIGQFCWVQNDISNAIKEFEKSLAIFEEKSHATYIYVPSANLALLYDEMGNEEKMYYYAIYTLDKLIELKKEKISLQLQTSKISHISQVIEKEFASFCLMLNILKKVNAEKYCEYQKIFSDNNVEIDIKLLQSTYYFHKEKYMIRS